MPITPQERELVIIGAAVAAGCKASIRQDSLLANQLHVTDKDIADAMAVAIDIRRSATEDIENFVSCDLVDEIDIEQKPSRFQDARKQALVSVSAAFAVNCVSGLKQQVARAHRIGIDENDLDAVIRLSSFIKVMATSHVERVMTPYETEDETDTLAEYGTPFGPERCAWAEVCKSESAGYQGPALTLCAVEKEASESTDTI